MNIHFQSILHLADCNLNTMSESDISLMKQKIKLLSLQLKLESKLRKLKIESGEFIPNTSNLELISNIGYIIKTIKLDDPR